jgi:nucleotide-binding universal stress UspA family protein
MFSKALIATDLSLASHHVICSATSLERLGLKEAVLLYCFVDALSDETMLAYKVIESARPMFMGQKKALEEKGFSVTGEMVVCRSYQEINRQAERNDCSLVVIGSSGKKMSSFGGVVNAVLHNLTRPTLVLRVRFQEERGEVVCKDCAFDPPQARSVPDGFLGQRRARFCLRAKDCGLSSGTRDSDARAEPSQDRKDFRRAVGGNQQDRFGKA